jgi:hypothetical protein
LRGASLAEPARQAGIDAHALQKTVADYYTGAVEGKDLQFRRGSHVCNRFLGDKSHTPNPCVAPVSIRTRVCSIARGNRSPVCLRRATTTPA